VLVAEHGEAPDLASEQLVQTLVHRRVEGMPGPDEDRVDVLVEIQMLLVKRELSVGRLRLTQPTHCFEAVGP
jgi:hypothetical protein